MREKTTNREKVFNKIVRLIVKDQHKGLEKFYNVYGKLIFSVAKNYCKTQEKINIVINSVLH